MPKIKCENRTRVNKWLLAVSVVVLTIVGLAISSSSLANAQARTEPMAQYKDPQGHLCYRL